MPLPPNCFAHMCRHHAHTLLHPPCACPCPAESAAARPHSSLGIGEGADNFSVYADSSAKGTPADSGGSGGVTSRRLSLSFGHAHHPTPAGAAAAAAAQSQVLLPGLLPLQVTRAAIEMPPVRYYTLLLRCPTLQEEDTPPLPGAKPRCGMELAFNPAAYTSPGLPAMAAQPGLAREGAASTPRLFMHVGRGLPAKPAGQRPAEGAAPPGTASSSAAGPAGKLRGLQGRCVAALQRLHCICLPWHAYALPCNMRNVAPCCYPTVFHTCRPAVPRLDLAGCTATAAAAAAATKRSRLATESAQPAAVKSSTGPSDASLAEGGDGGSQPTDATAIGQRQAEAAAADEPAEAGSPANKKSRPAVSPPRLVINCQLYEFTAAKSKVSEAGWLAGGWHQRCCLMLHAAAW